MYGTWYKTHVISEKLTVKMRNMVAQDLDPTDARGLMVRVFFRGA